MPTDESTAVGGLARSLPRAVRDSPHQELKNITLGCMNQGGEKRRPCLAMTRFTHDAPEWPRLPRDASARPEPLWLRNPAAYLLVLGDRLSTGFEQQFELVPLARQWFEGFVDEENSLPAQFSFPVAILDTLALLLLVLSNQLKLRV